jgi:hypothetical protein
MMHRFHWLLCAVPIAALILAAVVGYQGPLLAVAVLLCPLSMLLMMRSMHHEAGSGPHDIDSGSRAERPVRVRLVADDDVRPR